MKKEWEAALALWDEGVNLSPPEEVRATGAARPPWDRNEPLAYIDLERRQVVVNRDLLEELDAAGSLTAVLAHEVGHHVRFPHTLGLAAALHVLGARVIPGFHPGLLNLFFDLQVNEVVGRTHAGELAAVYRGFTRRHAGAPTSPLHCFYLAIYEELWATAPGALVPLPDADAMDRAHPGWRADARMFVQTFWALPDDCLQLVYFCCRFHRYLGAGGGGPGAFPLGGDVPRPDVDDYDGALAGGARAEDALEEARARGWLDEAAVAPARPLDPLAALDAITRHLPGHEVAAFREALVARHYRRLVDAHILPMPGTAPPPEPCLPTVLEDWEPGDGARAIDWTASVLGRGPLAAVAPLRRELEPDAPARPELALPAVEIYLDTSGSMPDPSRALNAMTLAAQVLAASAVRKGGIVRGVVYSAGEPLVSDWMYDEERARRFLLHYAGGGTEFPFALLARHAGEREGALRVVVSDGDFLHNLRSTPRGLDALGRALARSRALVAMLALPDDGREARGLLAPLLADRRFRLAVVRDLGQFAHAAAALARALLG